MVERLRLLFLGTPEFSVPTLRALLERHEVAAVVTRPDKPSGRGRKTTSSATKRCALSAGIVVEQPSTLRTTEAQQCLAAYEPDAIVVVSYGLILPPEILRIPRLGCVNLHASLLPRHRGASPIAAAILAGDSETGVTTMLMDEGLDTGAILEQRRIVIGPDATTGTLSEQLAQMGGELMLGTLRQLELGEIVPQPQDERQATMTRLARKQDGEIDWRLPAPHIERHVRAMQPWPGAWTTSGGERVLAWGVRVAEAEESGDGRVLVDDEVEADNACASPSRLSGTLVAVDPRPLVMCGGGAKPKDAGEGVSAEKTELLELVELQRAGRRRLPAAEVVRGMRLSVGDRLGTNDSTAELGVAESLA